MPLLTTKLMLEDAMRMHYAVGAFNIENLEMALAVIKAASELKSPVILATSQSSLKYCNPNVFFGMVNAMAETEDIPIALHLDHSESIELTIKAIESGYTSVMIDGSKLPYEENIKLTTEVVKYAQKKGIPVEGELGAIVGKKSDDDNHRQIMLTDPNMAFDFVNRTGVDSLAVAIGTVHGLYKETPHLDIERLKQISTLVHVPLVLHGASGLSSEQLHTCISHGICKVNIATDLRIAFTNAIKDYFTSQDQVFDPRKYGLAAQEAVSEIVKKQIVVLWNGKNEANG